MQIENQKLNFLESNKKINYQIKKKELIEEINFLRKYSNQEEKNINE